eukprot:4063157-Amphidinium_carterae.1
MGTSSGVRWQEVEEREGEAVRIAHLLASSHAHGIVVHSKLRQASGGRVAVNGKVGARSSTLWDGTIRAK